MKCGIVRRKRKREMSETIVEGSCPYYRYKPKEQIATTCDGDVVFQRHEVYGVCRSCNKEVPMIYEA